MSGPMTSTVPSSPAAYRLALLTSQPPRAPTGGEAAVASPRAPPMTRGAALTSRHGRKPMPLRDVIPAARSGGADDEPWRTGEKDEEKKKPPPLELRALLPPPPPTASGAHARPTMDAGGTTAAAATAAGANPVGASITPSSATSVALRSALPALTCWPASPPSTAADSRASKPALAIQLEARLSQCNGENVEWPRRVDVFAEVLRELKVAFPSFQTLFGELSKFVRDMLTAWNGSAVGAMGSSVTARIAAAEKEREAYYQGAMLQLLAERQRERAAHEALRNEMQELKRNRDLELNQLKRSIVETLNRGAPDENEMGNLKRLVNGLSSVNAELRMHVKEQDEELHRLRVACGDLPYVATKPLNQLVNAEYIAASKREMEHCRIATQDALLHAANDGRSVLQMKLRGLEIEAEQLREANQKLDALCRMKDSELHQIRFGLLVLPEAVLAALRKDRCCCCVNDPAPAGAAAAVGSTAETSTRSLNASRKEELLMSLTSLGLPRGPPTLEPESFEVRCYTPRPKIPIEVHENLGIETTKRTYKIVEDLSHLALQMRRDNVQQLQRYRQLQAGLQWCGLKEDDLVDLARRRAAAQSTSRFDEPFFKTVPHNDWVMTLHCLRTSVLTVVSNEHWSAAKSAATCYEFLRTCRRNESGVAFLQELRRYRDDRMLSGARLPALSERSKWVGTPLDLSVDDQRQQSLHGLVCWGYAVTVFARRHLLSISGGLRLTELTFATFTYNWWFSAKHFALSEPICDLFVKIVDGQLPLAAFEISQNCVHALRTKLGEAEVGGRQGVVPYRIAVGCLQWLFDGTVGRAAEYWRGAAAAMMLSNRRFTGSVVDGVSPDAVMEEESSPTQDASLLVKFVRRTVYTWLAGHIEYLIEAVEPLVFQSAHSSTIAVLSIAQALQVAEQLDAGEVPSTLAPVAASPSKGPAALHNKLSDSQLSSHAKPGRRSSSHPPVADAGSSVPSHIEPPHPPPLTPPEPPQPLNAFKNMPFFHFTFKGVLQAALDNAPKLNASVHSPPPPTHDEHKDGAAAHSKSSAKASKGHKTTRTRSTVTAMLNEITSDQSLAEWNSVQSLLRTASFGVADDELPLPPLFVLPTSSLTLAPSASTTFGDLVNESTLGAHNNR